MNMCSMFYIFVFKIHANLMENWKDLTCCLNCSFKSDGFGDLEKAFWGKCEKVFVRDCE